MTDRMRVTTTRPAPHNAPIELRSDPSWGGTRPVTDDPRPIQAIAVWDPRGARVTLAFGELGGEAERSVKWQTLDDGCHPHGFAGVANGSSTNLGGDE